jgi:hypothetical protein
VKKLALVLALVSPGLVFGQAAPVIRARLVPSDHVIVGQPVRLEVDVLVPNYFTGAPDFPSFELDGAIVTLSEDRPAHLNERIKGVAYAGIGRFYVIYPEQPTEFNLPPVQISVPYALNPPETARATLPLPPLRFRAVLPPEARGLDYFLPTSQLKIRQTWSGPLNQIRAGDSLTRTVTVTAEKMQAMLIPPVPLDAPEGVRVYPREPHVDDQKSEIGEFLQGVRAEKASYLFTKAGDYTLPAIEVTWWDLSSRKLTSSKIPATTIHVSESSAYVSELPPQPENTAPVQAPRHTWRRYRPFLIASCIALAVVALLAWAVRRWGSQVASSYRALKARRQNSEGHYWHSFKQACHQNNARRSYALLLAWLSRAHARVTLDGFQRLIGDRELDKQIAYLSEKQFRSPSNAQWKGKPLYAAIAKHRRATYAIRRTASHLPPLNPERSSRA